MAITLAESGLTSEKYAQLLAAYEKGSYRFIAHRSNLNFELDEIGLPETNVEDWDAVYVSDYDYVVYVIQGTVYVHALDPDTYPEPSPVAIFGYSNTARRASIIWESGKLYVFYRRITGSPYRPLRRAQVSVSPSGIVVEEQIDFYPELESSQVIEHIAATSKSRCYVVEKKSGSNTRTIVAFTHHGIFGAGAPWGSNIFYQYPFHSFDAISIDGGSVSTTDPLQDLLVVATQTPGITSVRAVNDSFERYIEISGGIIGFIAGRYSISDHFDIDVVDKVEGYRIRRSVRLSRIGDKIVCTAFSAQGTEEYNFGAYRMYTSKGGEYWSMGEILPLDYAPYDNGLKMLDGGDKVYLIDDGHFFISDKTIRFGHKPTSLQVDITRDILDCQVNQDRTLQMTITIDNTGGKYENHAVISPENVIEIEHYAGYFLPDDTSATNLLMATVEVDTLEYNADEDDQVVNMKARDHYAWMTDKSESENAEYWNGQLTQADTFIDNTETRYGGLRHTAVQSGTWQTQGGILDLRSSNEEGISFNTANPYIWNGGYRSKFKLATASGTEFAGLVFRAMDKDNLWYAVYEQSSDRIRLYLRRGGSSTMKAQTGTLGWSSTPTTWRWLEVTFRYGEIRVFYSLDGKSWTEGINYVADAVHEAGTSGPLLVDVGYVGHIARGFSPESNWTFPDFNFPDFTWFSFDWDFEYTGMYATKNEDAPEQQQGYYAFARDGGLLPPNPTTGITVTSDDDGNLAWTDNWSDASPNWNLVDFGSDTLCIPMCVKIDKHAPSGINAYVLACTQSLLGYHALYYAKDLDGTPSFELIWEFLPDEAEEMFHATYQTDMYAYFNADGTYIMMATSVETLAGTVVHFFEGNDPTNPDEWQVLDLRRRTQVSGGVWDGLMSSSYQEENAPLRIIANRDTRKLYTQSGIYSGETHALNLYEVVEIDLNTMTYESVILGESSEPIPANSLYQRYDDSGAPITVQSFQMNARPSIAFDGFGGNLMIGGVFPTDGDEFDLASVDNLYKDTSDVVSNSDGSILDGNDSNYSLMPNVYDSNTLHAQAFGSVSSSNISFTHFVTTRPYDIIFNRITNNDYWPLLSDASLNIYDVNTGGNNTGLTARNFDFKFDQSFTGLNYWIPTDSFSLLKIAAVLVDNPYASLAQYRFRASSVVRTITIYDNDGNPYSITITHNDAGQYDLGLGFANIMPNVGYVGTTTNPPGDPDYPGYPDYTTNVVTLGGMQTGISVAASVVPSTTLQNKIFGITRIVYEVDFNNVKLEPEIKYLDIGLDTSRVKDYELHGLWRVTNPTNPSLVLWEDIVPFIASKHYARPIKFSDSWDGTGFVAYSWAMQESGGINKLIFSGMDEVWGIAPGTVDSYEHVKMRMRNSTIIVWGDVLHQQDALGLHNKEGDYPGTPFITGIDFI